ncbi:SDR family NAD(P)-dependent oxidoreductase [Candidatus Nitrospira bockiana]
MPGVLASKVVLITGGSRGIGRATAEAAASAGARVAICARHQTDVDEVVAHIRDHGGEAIGRSADIGRPDGAQSAVRLAVEKYGSLDVLVNNAGILGPRVSLVEYPIEAWLEVLQINLTGTFLVTREAARAMLAQGGGTIISISSSVGRKGRAGWGAYAVAKAGIEGLSQVLADELKNSGIGVVTFNPGGTRTRMRAEAYPLEDPATVQDPAVVAAAIVRLAAAPAMTYSGQALDLSDLR